MNCIENILKLIFKSKFFSFFFFFCTKIFCYLKRKFFTMIFVSPWENEWSIKWLLFFLCFPFLAIQSYFNILTQNEKKKTEKELYKKKKNYFLLKCHEILQKIQCSKKITTFPFSFSFWIRNIIKIKCLYEIDENFCNVFMPATKFSQHFSIMYIFFLLNLNFIF